MAGSWYDQMEQAAEAWPATDPTTCLHYEAMSSSERVEFDREQGMLVKTLDSLHWECDECEAEVLGPLTEGGWL